MCPYRDLRHWRPRLRAGPPTRKSSISQSGLTNKVTVMFCNHSILAISLIQVLAIQAAAAELPRVIKVQLQPLAAHVQRLVDTLDYLGAPLPEDDRRALKAAATDTVSGVNRIQTVIDKHCLAGVRILPNNKLETIPGPAPM